MHNTELKSPCRVSKDVTSDNITEREMGIGDNAAACGAGNNPVSIFAYRCVGVITAWLSRQSDL